MSDHFCPTAILEHFPLDVNPVALFNGATEATHRKKGDVDLIGLESIASKRYNSHGGVEALTTAWGLESKPGKRSTPPFSDHRGESKHSPTTRVPGCSDYSGLWKRQARWLLRVRAKILSAPCAAAKSENFHPEIRVAA